jgi:hypothetical protein
MYEGDSILRPDASIATAALEKFRTPARAIDFVRSNTQAEAANQTAADIQAIVHAAHALRSAEMARLVRSAASAVAKALKTAHNAVVNWLERVENHQRDSFFAASANLADLEQRQRHWERTGSTHY